MTTVLDTNVLIDFEHGSVNAQLLIASLPAAAISRITWMEVLAGIDRTDTAQYHGARSMLSLFEIVEVTEAISEIAALIHFERNRAKRSGEKLGKIRHSDCLIHASAVMLQARLITRNARDFGPVALLGKLNVTVIMPYEG